MSRALQIASTGMRAQERKIESTANNLANMNTDGFKRTDARFADLMYQTVRSAGAQTSDDSKAPAPTQVGLGTTLTATVRDFSQGAAKHTGNNLDLMIEGNGFFGVLRNNEVLYTRNGALRTDANGMLVTTDGFPLEPEIRVPSDAIAIEVGANGAVEAIMDNDVRRELGQIRLYNLTNRNGLESMGRNLYRVTSDQVGEIREGTPGSTGFGSLQQGFLEAANVEVVEEMVAMIAGQRAYEANSKVIQTTDRMMEEANRLR